MTSSSASDAVSDVNFTHLELEGRKCNMRHFNPAVLNSEMQYSLFVSQLIVYNYNNEFEDNSLTGLVYFRP